MLIWRFPISDFDVHADMTYEDESKGVILSACMSRAAPDGASVCFKNGYAHRNWGSSYGYYYITYSGSSRPRVIWRPGEVATLRFTPWKGYRDYFRLTVNGEYAGYTYIYKTADVRPGNVAFGFDGGRGTVDNVVIKGKLDREWFLGNAMRAGR
jgi:hypothetical protein